MSEIVQWIKSGERGARAEFNDSDLITTLFLIKNEPMGRYKLQQELNLTDSSTKSLLNFCKKKSLLETIPKKRGHFLTKYGLEILEEFLMIITEHGFFNFRIFKNKEHYYTVLHVGDQFNSQIKQSWQVRDVVLAYGGEAILFLFYDGREVMFPEVDIKIDEYYPKLKPYLSEKTNFKVGTKCYMLIVGANSLANARKSALIASIKTFDQLNQRLSEITQ
ncbi:MAG: hypothetical protein FK734_04015 [Asgard group archaeon]|nr:hypothetical protein [Asgard group archaeon]